MSAGAANRTASYIVVLDADVPAAATVQRQASALGFRPTQVYRHALAGYAADLTASELRSVRADPSVDYVVPDGTLRLEDLDGGPPRVVAQEDPAQVLGNAIPRVGAPRSSTHSGNGRGSVDANVAVLDSGIDLQHHDLNVAGGEDCLSYAGRIDDREGHGTMVAGFIGALDNEIGRVGIAPGANLWAVRMANRNGFISTTNLLCGIDWVTGTRTDADPSNDIDVANLSLGDFGRDDHDCGATNHDAVHAAICGSVAEGVVYVAAAGNEHVDVRHVIPASYDEVLTATAMTELDGKPGGLQPPTGVCASALVAAGYKVVDDRAANFFSNYATSPSDRDHTVAGPGVCHTSTFGDDTIDNAYAYGSGTSFATPIVAGTVALCIASGPCDGLTPAQIVDKMVADAHAYAIAHPTHGFRGDPKHPLVNGHYFGHLIRPNLY